MPDHEATRSARNPGRLRGRVPAAGLGTACAAVAVAAILTAAGPPTLAAGRSSRPVALRAQTMMGLTIRTARLVVHRGASMRTTTVLTTASGRALYIDTADTDTHVACSGACAKIWPPLTTRDGSVDRPMGVPGRFTIRTGPNGRQVWYQGHPLYTYSGDMGPHQARGEGRFGTWFVATPTLTMNRM